MPCPNHNHRLWPKSGKHQLLIEACETQCGWCDYKTAHANNLRVHARRHINNPKFDTLKDITIIVGKAGRSRVALGSERTSRSPVPSQSTTQPMFPDIRPHSIPTSDTDTNKSLSHDPLDLSHWRMFKLESLLRHHGIEVPAASGAEPDMLYLFSLILARGSSQLGPRSSSGITVTDQSGTISLPEINIDIAPNPLSQSDSTRAASISDSLTPMVRSGQRCERPNMDQLSILSPKHTPRLSTNRSIELHPTQLHPNSMQRGATSELPTPLPRARGHQEPMNVDDESIPLCTHLSPTSPAALAELLACPWCSVETVKLDLDKPESSNGRWGPIVPKSLTVEDWFVFFQISH